MSADTQYHYAMLRAFAREGSTGNPAACIFIPKGAYPLNEDAMQRIAYEHKGYVSEVVFCQERKHAISYDLRYFSSECEVEFCGHGTIACMYFLIKSKSITNDELSIFTNKGELLVSNMVEKDDAVFIAAPDPEWITTAVAREDIAFALGISPSHINDRLPIEVINSGLNTLIVPIHNLEQTLAIHPDYGTLQKFCDGKGIDITLIFSLDVFDQTSIARTRVFAPKFGYLEDMATGSGNSAFGHYLKRHLPKYWGNAILEIEQGPDKINFNRIKLGAPNAERIFFGGNARLQVLGTYHA